MAYVDVRRAFPSVRRELLWHKLSELGASDSLVRALVGLYTDVTGSVKGMDGLSGVFDILFGTREGGVESPLLYVLFVADLISDLDNTRLGGAPVELDGRQLRALQLADDLALIARSEPDLNKLLQQWSHFCRRNHKETSIKKTEVVIYTVETDGSLSFANGVFQVDAA